MIIIIMTSIVEVRSEVPKIDLTRLDYIIEKLQKEKERQKEVEKLIDRLYGILSEPDDLIVVKEEGKIQIN
jgi:ribosomal protein RSM22 (predicted rRNA methylase)